MPFYRNLKLSSHAIRISCAGSYFCYLDLQSQILVLFLLIFVQHIFRFLLVLLHQQQQLLYIVQFHFSRMSDTKVTSQVVPLIRCNHRDVDNESCLRLVMLNVQLVYLHNAIDLLRNRRKMYHFVISVALANLCHRNCLPSFCWSQFFLPNVMRPATAVYTLRSDKKNKI